VIVSLKLLNISFKAMDKDTDSESVKRFQERLRYSVRAKKVGISDVG